MMLVQPHAIITHGLSFLIVRTPRSSSPKNEYQLRPCSPCMTG
jgi:hypothetical protein